jgi:DNA-binding NarL/FixJ family response regulator
VICVLIADDQRVVRDGLAMIVGMLDGVEVVGTAEDGEHAVALAGELAPGVVLMDLRMPGLNGAEATARLAPDVAVLVLTTYADDDSLLPALRAGARGYLPRTPAARRSNARSAPCTPGRRTSTPPSSGG